MLACHLNQLLYMKLQLYWCGVGFKEAMKLISWRCLRFIIVTQNCLETNSWIHNDWHNKLKYAKTEKPLLNPTQTLSLKLAKQKLCRAECFWSPDGEHPVPKRILPGGVEDSD